MSIQKYDTVRLKDGRTACIIEVFSQDAFLADVGDSPEDWDTIEVKLSDIDRFSRD